MDVILIPGLWLDASSWSRVTPPLVAAGHRVYPITLPGLQSVDTPRAGIGLRDHVDAVVARVDALDGPVILVGHSGGGSIMYAVVDARPDRIARAIYVDSGPLGSGGVINDELPVVGDDIPLPPRGGFEEADLVDMTDELWAEFGARAIPSPARVASDKQQLHDDRRYDVPATIIACEFPSSVLLGAIAGGAPWTAELARLRDVEYVDLPTGHWPQFTRPDDLAGVILKAIDRES